MRFRTNVALPRRRLALISTLVAITLTAIPAGGIARATTNHAAPHAHTGRHARVANSSAALSTFSLAVNPGLATGKPFACPAIQHASATITITNRFALNAQNDILALHATGLPPNTAFDLFLVEHSPLDAGTFAGFGFGWYQSDLQSNSLGEARVIVQGIFDNETFIENPANPFSPIHTYNVGFWFNSPTDEQRVCGNATAPAAGPFNGEQHAGLLGMITQGEPLQTIH